MSLNRRVHPRSLTDVRASVELADDTSLACVIRDRSDGGARLVFVQACGLPPTFRLRVLQHVSNAECASTMLRDLQLYSAKVAVCDSYELGGISRKSFAQFGQEEPRESLSVGYD